jgi:tRNA dimethylallyltransferase
MNWKNKYLIVIVGPTGVGKTDLSIKLAQKFGTEIISADSRQIFKEMNIGTAKPNQQELATVVHHFINTHSINEDYDAAQFGAEALATVHQLFLKHDFVIVCGGSGLYVKALLEGFDEIPEVASEIRNRIINEYEKNGVAWLQEQMKILDPEHFESVDQRNPHRLIRALEVKIGTGESISTYRRNKRIDHPFNVVKIGLELQREELFARINSRMDNMIEAGLFDEAKDLLPFKSKNALQTVGYQEIFDFIEGAYDREEAVRLLKRNSRRYAKRQLTWFKRDGDITWFSPHDFDNIVKHIQTVNPS